MANNEDFVERIKGTVRLESVMEQDGYHVTGRGRYQRCREHDSLVVDVHQQTYHWNQSGEWGDVISWVQRRKGYDFKESVEFLARFAGLPEPTWGGNSEARIASREREEAFGVASVFFHELLLNNDEALAYAKARGWTDETLKSARIGYSGGKADIHSNRISMRKLFADMHIDEHCAGAIAILGFNGNVAKLASEHGVNVNDRWVHEAYIPGLIGQDKLIYPHLRGGRVRYLSGRGIHEKKHFNVPAELAGDRQPYFNHVWSSVEDVCVVVEGQADAVTLAQWNIPAVALAGTSVNGELVKQIEGHKYHYVGMDSDAAGGKNALKVAKSLGPMCRLVEWNGIMTFTKYFDQEGNEREVKDANDLLRAMSYLDTQSHDNQVLGMQEALSKAPTLAETMAAWAGKQNGSERDDALKEALQVISQMDELSLAQYKSDLARAMRISLRDIGRMVKATQDLNKKKDETGESFTTTLGGVINGWLVEYLYDVEEHKASLAWKDPEGKIGSGDSVVIEGIKYLPIPPTDTFKNLGILFPSKLGTLKTTKELVAIIEHYIVSAYLLSDKLTAKIMSYYALLTWLYDSFNTIPYLRAMGEAGAGKSELMRRVGMVCYRLMIANGAGTAASLFRSVERYRGTVFIDEADLQQSDTTNDIVKFLNLGAMRNNPIWRLEEVIGEGGKKEYVERMYTTFCPKLIAMRKDFKDDAVGSRSLTFKIQPRETMELVNANIPLSIDDDMRARALAIRNLLVRWRLEHWAPEIPIDTTYYDLNISSRLNQVTGPLMAVAKDDPGLQEEMKRFLREYYAELTISKSMTITARVIEALWKIYKFPDLRKEMIEVDTEGEKVLVGSVTKIANEIIDEMNSSGEKDSGGTETPQKRRKDELSPQRIGRLIREELQLQVSGRTNKGFFVYWNQLRMEAVAKRYGINVDEVGPRNTVKQETLV